MTIHWSALPCVKCRTGTLCDKHYINAIRAFADLGPMSGNSSERGAKKREDKKRKAKAARAETN